MGTLARSLGRSFVIAIVSLAAAIALTMASVIHAAVHLTGTTALIVPGTGTKDPSLKLNYEQNAVDYYTSTTTALCSPTCAYAPVPYISEFWPFPLPGWGGLTGAKWNVSVASGVTNLNSKLVGSYNPSPTDPVVVFGFSQGSTVATKVKAILGDLTAEQKANIAFVLTGDPNRPNGGLFERLALLGTVPILDATFGQPAPTDTGIATTDIAFQYDGVPDFPLYPINLLADLNALAGFAYIHTTYLSPKGSDAPSETPYGYTVAEIEAMMVAATADCTAATHCQVTGDTRYITVPNKTLPILQPLIGLGNALGISAVITPLVDLVSPALRVLIETGYDRTLPYGTPAPFRLIPLINPITFTVDLVNAVGQGIQAALNDLVPVQTGVPATGSNIAARQPSASSIQARRGTSGTSNASRAAAATTANRVGAAGRLATAHQSSKRVGLRAASSSATRGWRVPA